MNSHDRLEDQIRRTLRDEADKVPLTHQLYPASPRQRRLSRLRHHPALTGLTAVVAIAALITAVALTTTVTPRHTTVHIEQPPPTPRSTPMATPPTKPKTRCAQAGIAVATTVALAGGLAACGGTSHPATATAVPSSSTSSTAVTTPSTTSPTTSSPATTSAPPTTEAPPTTKAAPTTATAPTTTRATAPAVCATAQLSLSSAGGFSAGGTSYGTYDFTNKGPRPCSMTGYPGVAVLNAQDQIVQQAAVRSPKPGTSTAVAVTTVVLGAGQKAQCLVASSDAVPNPDCATPYTGNFFQVYPPDQTIAILEPYTGMFCDLVVGPVQPAAG